MVRHDLATTWHQVRGMKYICVDVDQMDPNGHTYVMTLLAEQLMQSRYLSACGTYSLRTYHTHFIFSHLRFMYCMIYTKSHVWHSSTSHLACLEVWCTWCIYLSTYVSAVCRLSTCVCRCRVVNTAAAVVVFFAHVMSRLTICKYVHMAYSRYRSEHIKYTEYEVWSRVCAIQPRPRCAIKCLVWIYCIVQ